MNYNVEQLQEMLMVNKSPKVSAIYRAVIDLLNEGADVSSLKVSDITKRAGIGKGTAYDYFRSKEEIIAKAIIYDVSQGFIELYHLIHEQTDFRSKFLSFLHPVDNVPINCHTNSIKRYLNYFNHMQLMNLPVQLQQELSAFHQNNNSLGTSKIFVDIYEAAVAENLVSDGLDYYYVETALLTQLLSFMHYKEYSSHEETDITLDKIKNYLYENLIYMWRTNN